MTGPARRGAVDEGSAIRVIIGLVLVLSAAGIAMVGFSRLFRLLDAGGYGTPAVRDTLVVLGASGALLATGVAVLIWDVAKRFEGRPR